MSPDGSTLATASSDGTIQLWTIFEQIEREEINQTKLRSYSRHAFSNRKNEGQVAFRGANSIAMREVREPNFVEQRDEFSMFAIRNEVDSIFNSQASIR